MQPRIAYLIDRFIHAGLSEEEQAEWRSLLQHPDYEHLIQDELARQLSAGSEVPVSPDAQWDLVLQKIYDTDRNTARGRIRGGILRKMGWRMAAAASLLFVVVGGVDYFLSHRSAPVVQAAAPAVVSIIHPGTNKAVLTLANGQQIVLDDAHNGVIGQQGDVKVIKLDSGRLAYNGVGAVGAGPMYNTIATPRGGQYQIVLPDGTKVWLNAESSVRFPTAFEGATRMVELRGEAYFEVRGLAEKPFVVKANGTTTQVLGTDIDVMAYAEEGAVKTTLIGGAVRLGEGAKGVVLSPGEQGIFGGQGLVNVRAVNTKAVTAWKDGYYFFERTSVENVMRQIARWYDVDIVYQGGAPKEEIVGRIPRTAEVTEVLHIMELIGIRFKIEGRTITVLE